MNKVFINFLKNNENTRKVFGKRELKIIEKQLWAVNLTQSEKNRLSRDIRKKLEFIREASKFSEEFELKKGKIVKEIIENTLETIKKHKWFWKINEIILFGSKAENRFHLFSDIDIAVKLKNMNKEDALLFRKEILRETDDKVDVQVYNLLPDKIKREIDKNGRILFKKQN